MRILIVGAGVIGLLTAMEAVAAGHRVVVCDSGPIPNPCGASHDHHRVLRALHPGDPLTTAAALRAHRAWLGLDARFGGGLYRPTGALTVLDGDGSSAGTTTDAEVEALAMLPRARAVGRAAYPVIEFDRGIFEPDAGVLLAARVLAALGGWLRRHPHAELRENRPVTAVTGTSVRFADGHAVDADAVLVAAGPWSRALVPDGDLVLYRQSVLYADPAGWEATPPVRGLAGGGWTVPPVAGTPLKVSASSACRVVDAITDHTTAPVWRDHLRDLFPTVAVTGARDCYYLARASTGGAAVAELGPGAVAFAACGGGAFKFAPLIAVAMVDRLTRGVPLDPARFPHSILRGVS